MESNTKKPVGADAVTVEVQDIKKAFGDLMVLDGVSFRVEPGEVFVLMGASGAGKSVLLRHMVNLEKADAGRILIDGDDASEESTHLNYRSAFVFQAGALFNSLTVFDNLAFYLREHRAASKSAIRERVERTLEMLNLTNAAQKLPSELSGGMRKRVAIARALVMEPQLLLYDEPTSELDPDTAANISEIIATLREEFAVTSIVVSHDRDLALTIADRVALLDKGRVRLIGEPQAFRESDDSVVKNFFAPVIDPKNPRFRRT